MSRFDANPFDEETSANSYSSKPTRGVASSSGTGSFFDNMAAPSGLDSSAVTSRPTPLPPESRSGSTFDAASDIPFSPRALTKKQKELRDKEAALRRKEQELSSREEALGVVRPNWPPCFPIIRHDIRADIPEYLRPMQRAAFLSWLGAVTALTYNFIAVMLAWIVGAVSSTWGIGNFFLALIFVLLGVPLSFLLWYRRLYYSLKKDSSIGLMFFFCSYVSHIMWFTLFSIAPPIVYGGKFLCGVMTTIDMFANHSNSFIGIMYAIGTGLFISEVLLSVWVLLQVYAYFRGTGKANQLKQEAAMAALRNRV